MNDHSVLRALTAIEQLTKHYWIIGMKEINSSIGPCLELHVVDKETYKDSKVLITEPLDIVGGEV